VPFHLHKLQGLDIVSFTNPSCEGGETTQQHQARTNLTAIACSEESVCGWSGVSSTRTIPEEGRVTGMFFCTPRTSSYVLGEKSRSH